MMAKLSASRASAAPIPPNSTARPASTGPTQADRSQTTDTRVFAPSRSSSATSSGTATLCPISVIVDSVPKTAAST